MLVLVFLSIIFIISVSLISYVMNHRVITQLLYNDSQALSVAEAGIDKAVWCFNNPSECAPNYNGETANIGNGQYATVVTSVGQDYHVTSTATVNKRRKIIEVTVSKQTTTSDASFFYGVQVGAGGLEMEENSYVIGNIYSNGSIAAGNGAYITGDVYVAGGTSLTADQQQTNQTSQFIFGRRSPNPADIAQSFKPGVTEVINKVSFYLKKAGNPNNATVYITANDGGKPAITSLASGTLYSTQVTGTFSWIDVTFSSNPTLTQNQTYWIVVDANTHDSNYYISGIHDNVGYGNGIGRWSLNWSGGSWTDASGDFTFKTWMGGVIMSMNNVTVGCADHSCSSADCDTQHGNAYAHQILNSWVKCDAYYKTDPADIAGTTVKRTKYPNSVDPPPENMPISDGQIADWKAAALENDPIEGDYTVSDDASLGPIKITGSLTVDINVHLTLTGTIWVVGDITFGNGSTTSLDTTYGASSGLIVSDGVINASNGSFFEGSGDPASYIMVLSTNSSLTEPGAMNIVNNANPVIFYAAHGMATIQNNANLKEVTAYKLKLKQNAWVEYESGLATAKFANGPGGVWKVINKTWQEIK